MIGRQIVPSAHLTCQIHFSWNPPASPLPSFLWALALWIGLTAPVPGPSQTFGQAKLPVTPSLGLLVESVYVHSFVGLHSSRTIRKEVREANFGMSLLSLVVVALLCLPDGSQIHDPPVSALIKDFLINIYYLHRLSLFLAFVGSLYVGNLFQSNIIKRKRLMK